MLSRPPKMFRARIVYRRRSGIGSMSSMIDFGLDVGLTVPRPGDQRHGKRTTKVRNCLQKANRSTNRSRSINNDAGRTHQLSPSLIDRWRKQFREQKLVDRPSTREQQLQTENEKLKAKIGDLVMQNDQLKKLQDYAQRLRNVDTSVITAKNLDQFRKGSK